MAPTNEEEVKDNEPRVEVFCNPSGPLTFHKQKVMVEITAPVLKSATGDLDIVAVMDISGSMDGPKLQLMKETMYYVINKLTEKDRLAVVAFYSEVDRSNGDPTLINMDDDGKKNIRRVVEALTAKDYTNIKAGLVEGIKIIKERKYKLKESEINPACIFLMSDGEQNVGGDARLILEIPDFTVHTFGFGIGHDERVLAEIAYRSISGVYSNVPDSTDKSLTKAMASQLAIGRSITALDVTVKLTPVKPAPEDPPTEKTQGQEVGSISVDGGDYMVTDGQDSKKRCGPRVIRFGDLARHESRRIIVDIPLHGITASIPTAEQILKVECFYRLPKTMRGDPDTKHVVITRNGNEKTDHYDMLPKVKRELVRRQQAEYLRMIKVWTDQGKDKVSAAIFEVATAKAVLVRHYVNSPDDILNDELTAELTNIESILTTKKKDDQYIKICGAYLLACLSSHGRQRFASRGGELDEYNFYVTERIGKYIRNIATIPPHKGNT